MKTDYENFWYWVILFSYNVCRILLKSFKVITESIQQSGLELFAKIKHNCYPFILIYSSLNIIICFYRKDQKRVRHFLLDLIFSVTGDYPEHTINSCKNLYRNILWSLWRPLTNMPQQLTIHLDGVAKSLIPWGCNAKLSLIFLVTCI